MASRINVTAAPRGPPVHPELYSGTRCQDENKALVFFILYFGVCVKNWHIGASFPSVSILSGPAWSRLAHANQPHNEGINITRCLFGRGAN
ncbi:unnamed protein product, partial [Iphiclides podalirius]